MLEASLGVSIMTMPMFRTSEYIAPIHRHHLNAATLPALRERPRSSLASCALAVKPRCSSTIYTLFSSLGAS